MCPLKGWGENDTEKKNEQKNRAKVFIVLVHMASTIQKLNTTHTREREMLVWHEGRMKIIYHPWRSKLSLTVKITNCSYKDIKLKGEGNESYEKKPYWYSTWIYVLLMWCAEPQGESTRTIKGRERNKEKLVSQRITVSLLCQVGYVHKVSRWHWWHGISHSLRDDDDDDDSMK